MSARSIVRASHRDAARRERRSHNRARRAGVSAVAALGAGLALAPGANAANFEVSNLNDDGAGSLRDAIVQANAAAGADTVTFAPGLSGTITLTSGDIDIDEAVDIQGPGASTLAVSGDESSGIFYVATDETVGALRDPVTISGLELTEGDSGDGGAIYASDTDLRLSAMTLSGNYASSNGGAIDVESSIVSITDSRIIGNTSGSEGGAMYTDGDADADPGDTVTITNSVVRGNSTAGDGGAFYFDNATGGAVLITKSELSDNEAEGSVGGAIYFYGHQGGSTIRQSTISGNRSDGAGGGIYFDSAYTHPEGLIVEDSTITGNRAGSAGGGVYVNNADEKPVAFVATTVTDNRADGEGGGIYRDDFDVNLTNTVVANNDAIGSDGEDLGQDGAATGSFITGFSLIERDADLVTITENPAGSNLTGINPQLGELADNGGPTDTQLPALTSPIVDAGTAAGLTVDQRDLTRTVQIPAVPDRAGSDGTDMGAAEVQDTELTGAEASGKKKQKVKGKKIKVKVKAGADEVVDLVASGSVKAGKSYKLKKKTADDVAAGSTKSLTLKPKGKKAGSKIADHLAKKGKAKATVEVQLTDVSGNSETKKVKVTLVPKGGKKK
jgi:hypothetical protein